MPIREHCVLAVKVMSLLLGELLPQQHLARPAQSYEVECRLAKIDANRMNLHVNDPP